MKHEIIDNKEGTLSFTWNPDSKNYNVIMTDKHPLNTEGEGSDMFGGTVTHPDLIGYDCWISRGVSVIGECKITGGTIIESEYVKVVNTNLDNCRIYIYYGQMFESNLNNLDIAAHAFDCKDFDMTKDARLVVSGHENLSIVRTSLLGNLMVRTSIDNDVDPNETNIINSEIGGNIMIRGLGFDLRNSRITPRAAIINENYLELNNITEL